MMRDTRALVTGANGFLGRTLTKRIRQIWPDAEVFGADLTPPVHAQGSVCDLSDPAATAELISSIRPTLVFHCAGIVQGKDVQQLEAALLRPTRVLLGALSLHAPEAVLVVPGSAAEYGRLPVGKGRFTEDDEPAPLSVYGQVKAAQTAEVLEAAEGGLDARVGRVFNLLGPGAPEAFLAGRVAAALAAIAAGQAKPVLSLGALDGTRDFLDVRDACDALLAIAVRGRGGRIYNVCTGIGRTGRDLVDAFLELSAVDARIVESGVGSSRGSIEASVGSPERAARECGWRATTAFAESVRSTYESARLARRC